MDGFTETGSTGSSTDGRCMSTTYSGYETEESNRHSAAVGTTPQVYIQEAEQTIQQTQDYVQQTQNYAQHTLAYAHHRRSNSMNVPPQTSNSNMVRKDA